MPYNLIEDGYRRGDVVYHVTRGVVNDDGELEYEPYSDEFYLVEECEIRPRRPSPPKEVPL